MTSLVWREREWRKSDEEMVGIFDIRRRELDNRLEIGVD